MNAVCLPSTKPCAASSLTTCVFFSLLSGLRTLPLMQCLSASAWPPCKADDLIHKCKTVMWLRHHLTLIEPNLSYWTPLALQSGFTAVQGRQCTLKSVQNLPMLWMFYGKRQNQLYTSMNDSPIAKWHSKNLVWGKWAWKHLNHCTGSWERQKSWRVSLRFTNPEFAFALVCSNLRHFHAGFQARQRIISAPSSLWNSHTDFLKIIQNTMQLCLH